MRSYIRYIFALCVLLILVAGCGQQDAGTPQGTPAEGKTAKAGSSSYPDDVNVAFRRDGKIIYNGKDRSLPLDNQRRGISGIYDDLA